MSHDLYLMIDTGGENLHEIYSTDFTYNLTPMFKEAGFHLRDFTGMTADRAARVLNAYYVIMEADPDRFKAFDAPNKWGTYDQTMPRLRGLIELFMAHPLATVVVVS